MKRLLAVSLLMGVLFAFFIPNAFADYTDTATNKPIVALLTTANHVVVDPKASPALPNPDAINNQIMQTGLPMWVVNVAKNQTVPGSQEKTGALATLPVKNALFDSNNPITNKITVNGEQRDPPLIILVIDANGYHARAFNVNQSIADATGPSIVQSAANHRKDLNGTVSAFVSAMAGTPATGPVISNVPPPPPPPQPMNWAFAWALLWAAVAGAVGVAGWWLWCEVAAGRERRAHERNAVQDRINNAQFDIANLAQEVLKGQDVSAEQMRAELSLSNAEKAMKDGDIANARSHAGIAQRDIDAAYRVINPDRHTPQREHVTALSNVPKKDRRKTRVRATSPRGDHVTIKNHDYKMHSLPGYRNYYEGGVYEGVPFPAGWYPYMFWSNNWSWAPSDVVAYDEPLHHDFSGSHDGGASTTFDHSDSGHRNSGASASFSEPTHHHSSSGSDDSGASTSFGSPSISGGSDGGGSAGF